MASSHSIAIPMLANRRRIQWRQLASAPYTDSQMYTFIFRRFPPVEGFGQGVAEKVFAVTADRGNEAS